MKKFKITITCGAYEAPCLIEYADTIEQAVMQAKQKSGLSRFKNWLFIPQLIIN